MTDLISVQLTGHVAVVEMHRPPNNFFDEALLASLAETLAALDEDGPVRCVVLCSEGKHFCAGAQLDGIRIHSSLRGAAVGCDNWVPCAAGRCGSRAAGVFSP